MKHMIVIVWWISIHFEISLPRTFIVVTASDRHPLSGNKEAIRFEKCYHAIKA